MPASFLRELRGQLVVVGAAPDPISVQTSDLIFGGRSIVGSLTGSSIENQDNLAFSLGAWHQADDRGNGAR